MKKINICIVGLGNIGYFHLFSLLRSSKNVNFIIIDKTKKNFLKIKKKFNYYTRSIINIIINTHETSEVKKKNYKNFSKIWSK